MEVLFDLDSKSEVAVVCATFGVSLCFLLLVFLCLKIKSTKKTPELLGTVGTVKKLDETNSSPQTSFKAKPSPRLRPVSTVSDVIHDVHLDHGNRTPSRAGERKLPDIPYENYEHPENGGSELYATLGSALAEGGSDSEEAETEPTESNHPYAKVRKVRDHPYATVQPDVIPNGAASLLHRSPEDIVDSRPQPHMNQSQPQYFSGDSQDSSKGYTSISVREPLRHIRPNPSNNVPNVTNSNYAPVSEASDDMYAAIEDPTYIPTGNQSNSDTYAVINLPEDEIEENDEVALRSAHTYSKVDRNRKRKAVSQPNPNAANRSNVDEMYAKVQKNVPIRTSWNANGYERLRDKKDPGYETVQEPSNTAGIDNLPMGASAMRTSAEQLLGARPRAPPLPSHHKHHHHHHAHHVNYSDFEVTHFDPNMKKPPPPLGRVPNNAVVSEEVGYETVPESHHRNDHEGYERVEDYWRGDDGYELVRGHSKRSNGGFERLTFSSSNKKHDPGYETVRDPPPLPRHHPGYIDPPYARLEKDEEESEEGYETIPASEQRKHSHDPGYESVANDKPEPGYETVPPKSEPGYETVPNDVIGRSVTNRQSPASDSANVEPGYETLTKKESKSSEHGYETVPALSLRDVSSPALSDSANVVHLTVRKTNSDPPASVISPHTRPRSAAASVVVIEPNKIMAVNNNLETKTFTNPSTDVENADNNVDVQAHIFV